MSTVRASRYLSLSALLLSLAGGMLLVVCDDLTLQAPALLVLWGASVMARDGTLLSSTRRLIPIALSAFGITLLTLLAGTSSPLGIRDALGTANVALVEALPLRLAVVLAALGPLAALLPRSLGGLVPINPQTYPLDGVRAAAVWWAGAGALLRLLFGVLPPLMQGLRLEVLLPLIGGALALAGGVLAFAAQTGTRLLAAMMLARTGIVLAGGSSFEGDVVGAIAASALLDGVALAVAIAALRRLSRTVEGEWVEEWTGAGLIDRGPALALVLAVGVLAGVPGTVAGLTLLMQSRAVVAAGNIVGPLLLALAWTLCIVALLRTVRVLYLRAPHAGLQGRTRRWRPGYLALAFVVAGLALPPLASITYRVGRYAVTEIVDAVHPQSPSSPPTQ